MSQIARSFTIDRPVIFTAPPLIGTVGFTKFPVRIQVTYPYLRDLAGRARDSVLVALSAGRGIEQWAKSRGRIVNFLKLRLVRGKGISRRFWYSIAGAFRARVLCDGWCTKPRWGFSCRLLRQHTYRD